MWKTKWLSVIKATQKSKSGQIGNPSNKHLAQSKRVCKYYKKFSVVYHRTGMSRAAVSLNTQQFHQERIN